MASPDPGYTNLLSFLREQGPANAIPLSHLQATISHHLARLSPSPTPLVAALIASPLFVPYSNAKLELLAVALRYAVHQRFQLLKDSRGGLLKKGLRARLGDWSKGVVLGLKGGHAILRLAASGGLLVGLEDINASFPLRDVSWRRRVQDTVVLAVAETMDLYVRTSDGWVKEFLPETENGEVDALSLALIRASQSLPLVLSEKFCALPLEALIQLLISTLSKTFNEGKFLATLSSSLEASSSRRTLEQTLRTISSSPLMASMPPLSKLTARSLALLVEERPEQGLSVISETLRFFESTAARMEADWSSSPLAGAPESEIAPEARELSTTIWSIFKTFLFSVVLITDESLSALAYVKPKTTTSSSAPLHSQTLALQVLRILSHCAFIITQFGGVTTTSTPSFPQLKRVFYMALDFSALDDRGEEAEALVKRLVSDLEMSQQKHPRVAEAKCAYTLACIEQLVPVLNEECLEHVVLPMCLPRLSDSSHRETYESAHSVVLAIFAAHAARLVASLPGASHRTTPLRAHPIEKGCLADKLVPFYVECLIANSKEGGLIAPQLCMAFAALTRSAASPRLATLGGANKAAEEPPYILAQFCIDALVKAIHGLSKERDASASDHLHRLHLMLVSAVSSLPLALLPSVLREIRDVIVNHPAPDQRTELIEHLFQEISEKVGQEEKEYVIRWWGMESPRFASLPKLERDNGTTTSSALRRHQTARL